MSPLLFVQFHANFLNTPQTPVLSATGYKWIFALLAIDAIPGAVAASWLFERYGPALCCVVANIVTGGTALSLLFVALIEPPTALTLGVFAAIMYTMLPVTVVSQVSTGPMLDRYVYSNYRTTLSWL